MDAFTTLEMAAMQSAAEDTMMDTCVVQTVSTSKDATGYPVPSTSDGSAIACGVNVTGRSRGKHERQLDTMLVTKADVLIRVPSGTDISETDKIKVTHRFGVELSTPISYEVVGVPEEGVSATVLPCEKVTT